MVCVYQRTERDASKENEMIEVERVESLLHVRVECEHANQIALWIRKAMGITSAPPAVRELQQVFFEAAQSHFSEDASPSAGFRTDADC